MAIGNIAHGCGKATPENQRMQVAALHIYNCIQFNWYTNALKYEIMTEMREKIDYQSAL